MRGWRNNGGRGRIPQVMPPSPIPGTASAQGLPNTLPRWYDHAWNWIKTARVALWVGAARMLVRAFGYNVYHREDVIRQRYASALLERSSRHNLMRWRAGFPVSQKLRMAADLLRIRAEITEARPWRRKPGMVA